MVFLPDDPVDPSYAASHRSDLYQPDAGEHRPVWTGARLLLADRAVVLYPARDFCAPAECVFVDLQQFQDGTLHPPDQRDVRVHHLYPLDGSELPVECPRWEFVDDPDRDRRSRIHLHRPAGGEFCVLS